MAQCKKVITNNYGYKGKCSYKANPKNKDGLCTLHHNLALSKDLSWIAKKGYREITESELVSGNSIKLKTDTKNKLYRYKQGKIYWYRKNANIRWTETQIELNRTLFCIKD